MPKLINYLGRVEPGRYFDDIELDRLQQVYDDACAHLEVPIGDPRRERVALLIFEHSQCPTDDLLVRVVNQFRAD